MGKTGRSLLLLFVAANLLNYLDRYVLASILEPVGKSLSLSDTQLGQLASVFLLVYIFSAPFFSWAAERTSRTKLVAFGILLWSLATSAAAFADSFGTLLLSRALVGVGEAAYATIGPAILADIIPEHRRAKAFTWFYLAVPVGSALGFALGGAVESFAGWRMSFLLAGLPGLILAFAFWRMAEPQIGAMDAVDPDAKPGESYWQKFAAVCKNRVFLACTFCYVGYTFAMGALTHWAPTLFQRNFGESASEAGLTFGAIAVLTGITGTLLGGELTHRSQARYPNAGIWISLVTLLASLPFVYLGLIQTSAGPAYALWAVGMFLLFINTSPVNAITVSSLPARLRSMGMAVNILFCHLLGDAISPTLVGMRSEAQGSGGSALAAGLMITLPALVFAAVTLIPALKRRTAFEAPKLSNQVS